jgi:hypothetical protein
VGSGIGGFGSGSPKASLFLCSSVGVGYPLCLHTAPGRPWMVVVVIEFADEGRAVAFERFLKSGSGVAFAVRHFRRPKSTPNAMAPSAAQVESSPHALVCLSSCSFV